MVRAVTSSLSGVYPRHSFAALVPSYGPPGVSGQLNNLAVPGLAEVMGPLPSLGAVKSAVKGSFSPSQVMFAAMKLLSSPWTMTALSTVAWVPSSRLSPSKIRCIVSSGAGKQSQSWPATFTVFFSCCCVLALLHPVKMSVESVRRGSSFFMLLFFRGDFAGF